MPILSPQIQDNLEKGLVNKEDNYYCREWGWAVQRGKDICIMPVGINGADKQSFNLLNKQLFKEEKDYVSGTDLTQAGAWKKLLKDIENIYNH